MNLMYSEIGIPTFISVLLIVCIAFNTLFFEFVCAVVVRFEVVVSSIKYSINCLITDNILSS